MSARPDIPVTAPAGEPTPEPGSARCDDTASEETAMPPQPRKPRTAPHECGGCDETWTATGAAHCGCCHRTFAGLSLFDAHRNQYGERGHCEDPATLTSRARLRVAFLRDGMWRGPEMDEATKTARFGGAA